MPASSSKPRLRSARSAAWTIGRVMVCKFKPITRPVTWRVSIFSWRCKIAYWFYLGLRKLEFLGLATGRLGSIEMFHLYNLSVGLARNRRSRIFSFSFRIKQNITSKQGHAYQLCWDHFSLYLSLTSWITRTGTPRLGALQSPHSLAAQPPQALPWLRPPPFSHFQLAKPPAGLFGQKGFSHTFSVWRPRIF